MDDLLLSIAPEPSTRLTIAEPGIYDLSSVDYHADPAPTPSLSASVAAILVNTRPAHAWIAHPRLNPQHERTEDRKYDLGSVAHALMLGKSREIKVIDAADWRTNAAKQQRADAIADGLQPCLVDVYNHAADIVHAGRQQLDAHEDGGECFTDGLPERTALWREGSIWCRSQMDWLRHGHRRIEDYKTTGLVGGADPVTFLRGLLNRCGDVQDPFYSRGLAVLEGIDYREIEFVFVVQETEPPYALSIIRLDGQSREFAASRAEYATMTFEACMSSGVWPGWHTRTYQAQIPGYAQARWTERMMSDQLLDELRLEGR